MTLDKQERDAHEYLHAILLKKVGSCTVVLSTISAITYVGALRPPHPLGNDTTNAVHSVSSYLSLPQKLFFYLNSFSFLSAMCGLLLTASTSLSPHVLSFSSDSSSRDEHAATKTKHLAAMIPKVVYAGVFQAISMTSSAGAFVFAGLSSVKDWGGRSERLALTIPCAIGMFVFLQALFISARDGVHFWMQVSACDEQLWDAIKKQTLCGRMFTKCGELLQPRSHYHNTSHTSNQHKALPQHLHPPHDMAQLNESDDIRLVIAR